MVNSLIVLVALGIGPPFVYSGGADLTGFQGPSFDWSYSGRDVAFGFGSDAFGDWSYGEIRVRQPLVEFPTPRTYSGGGFVAGGAQFIEVPVWRERWPRRQKIKLKIKDRRW